MHYNKEKINFMAVIFIDNLQFLMVNFVTIRKRDFQLFFILFQCHSQQLIDVSKIINPKQTPDWPSKK